MKKNSTENVWRVLGLESSCDDTAASVLKIVDNNKEKKVEILSSIVFNQNKLHVNFNGVVPEIAARAHCEKIDICTNCLLYTSPSPRDRTRSRMPSSA